MKVLKPWIDCQLISESTDLDFSLNHRNLQNREPRGPSVQEKRNLSGLASSEVDFIVKAQLFSGHGKTNSASHHAARRSRTIPICVEHLERHSEAPQISADVS